MWSKVRIEIKPLTLPKLLPNKLVFESTVCNIPDQKQFITRPFQCSELFESCGKIVSKSTEHCDKEIYCISLAIPDTIDTFEPGDTIGILTENTDASVNTLLEHIGESDLADETISLNCNESKKKLPQYTTRRALLKNFVNFFAVPTKLFLRGLAEYCGDPDEMRVLQILCSKEGVDSYRAHILEAGVNAYTIITSLQTCKPSTMFLAEHLPPLLPRPYSIASSPVKQPHSIRIAFSVLEKEKEGLCTGMLRRSINSHGENLILSYLRQSHGFRLPIDESVPVIMVGLGTGIAPYIGFLEHRSEGFLRGKMYLINGFRYKTDFIFRKDIEDLVTSGILTQCFEAYSRESDVVDRYVQDIIIREWKQFGKLIVEEGALIYECGESSRKNEPVIDAFVKVIQDFTGVGREEAVMFMKKMKLGKRYLMDSWS